VSTVVQDGALVMATMGLVTLVVLGLVGHPRAGVRAALELWTGASLLRLSASSSWKPIIVAAVMVAVRVVVGQTLAGRSGAPAIPTR